MKSWSIVLLSLLVLVGCEKPQNPSGEAARPPTAPASPSEPDVSQAPDAPAPTFPAHIQALESAADVGTDEAFKTLLEAHKQRLDLEAPSHLRAFLTAAPLKRMRISRGYHHAKGEHVLSWFFAELAAPGSPEAILAAWQEVLGEQGLKPSEEHAQGPFTRAFAGGLPGDRREIARMEPPQPAVGGDEPWAGGMLDWSVSVAGAEPPQLSEVLEALPYLADARVDAAWYEAMGAVPVSSVGLGGTWTKYYSLSVSFQPEEKAESVAAQAVEALVSVGFVVEDEGVEMTRLKRASTGSFAQVYVPDALGRVQVHIQPES